MSETGRIIVDEKYFQDRQRMIETLFAELRTQRQRFKELFDTIPLDYNKFSEKNYEFYNLGSKSRWIEWLKKFEKMLKEK